LPNHLLLRKSFAILLLSLQVFSLGGYWLVSDYFEAKADRSVIQSLDDNRYDEGALVTIRLPLHLPYACSQDQFERYDGSIRINGVFYNYVKRKFYNDTLTLVCIANQEKTRLHNANAEYAKTAGDAPASPSSSGKAMSALLKLFLLDYKESGCNGGFASFTVSPAAHIVANDNKTCSCFIPEPAQPPETA
jgi:hypothetical protein